MNITIKIFGPETQMEFLKLTSSDVVDIYKDYKDDPTPNYNSALRDLEKEGMWNVSFDDKEELGTYDLDIYDNDRDEDLDLNLSEVTLERIKLFNDDGITGGDIRYHRHAYNKKGAYGLSRLRMRVLTNLTLQN